jgi:hypothetical protein
MDNKWYEDYMRSHSHVPGLNKNIDLARRCMIRKMKIILCFTESENALHILNGKA